MALQLRANDIFGWNKTRSKESYAGYSMKQTFNGHTAYVLFSISYRFGRDKVNNGSADFSGGREVRSEYSVIFAQ